MATSVGGKGILESKRPLKGAHTIFESRLSAILFLLPAAGSLIRNRGVGYKVAIPFLSFIIQGP